MFPMYPKLTKEFFGELPIVTHSLKAAHIHNGM